MRVYKMTGYIHSLQSLGTVDGPGVRAVVFASGCPYRCVYCHNPDTWKITDGAPTEISELVAKIERLLPYIKDGGVTLSGGEPCMQAEFFLTLTEELHRMGLHVALDPAAAVLSEDAVRLISRCDLILLDVKFTNENDYNLYTGGTLSSAMRVLDLCEEGGLPVWIRHVIIPGINDNEADVKKLRQLIRDYKCIERVEFLPFKKLCLEKYDALGIPFPLREVPEADSARADALLYYYNSL